MAIRHPSNSKALVTEPDNALAMLTAELQADHAQARDLFRQYRTTTDPDVKQTLTAQIFAALEHHTLLAEAVFYPALAVKADEDGARLIDGAYRDHQVVREGIAALRAIDDAAVCEAFFHQWMLYVEQHIEEEERALFPKAA
jgi:hypothetical protein